MTGNAEIRREAWGIVRSRWLGRIFAAGGSLYLIAMSVSVAIILAYMELSVQTWPDFLRAKFEHWRQGLGYTVPSMSVFWQMTGASLFQQFIGYIFGAIVLFGLANLMLKAARNEEDGWFAAAYGGFKRPFEVCWLLLLMNLRVFLWSLLFVIPGIVAIYRYRQAWYLKGEHPDWGASKCLAESGAMMKGHKMQAFGLDVSYLWRILLAWILFAVLVGTCFSLAQTSPLMGLLGALLAVVGIYLLFFAVCYFFVGRAVFCRELLACARACDML